MDASAFSPDDRDALKARVAALGLNQSDVARRIGFSQAYVNRAWTMLSKGQRVWDAVRNRLPEWEAQEAEVEV
ncbi:MAG: hypothetical protein LCH53_04565 [Bacteroidetes bacterium]|nr:hypothetical protein [Bacteroidota bacterium]